MTKRRVVFSHPPGAGGNWLENLLHHGDLTKRPHHINFHDNEQTFQNWDHLEIVRIHSLNPNEFSHLFSGSHFFNFYANILFKYWHYKQNVFTPDNYHNALLSTVQTARYLSQFASVNQLIYFDFDHLINRPSDFYQQVNRFAQTYEIPVVPEDDFEARRQCFLQTMIDVNGLYENFDNMIWVCFILGQLMEKNLAPDFPIAQKENQSLCKQFAKDHYVHCDPGTIYLGESNLKITNFLC